MVRLALGLVFLSGSAGLVYQVTWQKYLSALVGSHASATAAILSLFFLFLSVGYFLFGRYAIRLMKNQLALYGVIELLIGLYALYSPPLFNFIFYNYISSPVAGASEGLVSALILGGAFIALPTILMGGTIPVITQALSSSFEVSAKTHAYIYALNTLGAVVGCVLGGFVFIERFGLDGTLLLAGNTNILIALVTLFVVRRSANTFEGPEQSKTKDENSMPIKITLSLFVVSFLSGYTTFSLEKLVIRMAGLSLGSSTYTYTIIVGAFIFAIGLGSLILTLNRRFEKPQFFGLVQLGTLGSVIWLYYIIPSWPEWFMRVRLIFLGVIINFNVYWITVFLTFLVILIIPVGLIGANLPLLFGILRVRHDALSKTVGRLYAINCLGACAGAAFGGYWIFHFFDASNAFRVLVVTISIATIMTAFIVFEGRSRMGVLSLVALMTGTFFLLPKWSESQFTPGAYNYIGLPPQATDVGAYLAEQKKNGKIIFSRNDPNTFANVIEMNDQERNLGLYVNGKPDAVTGGDHVARAMAALTPMGIAGHDVKNVFVIGLGAGLSTAILTKFSEVESVEVAEISEGVVQSLPYFQRFNYGLESRMGKVKIEVDDAYRVLMTKPKNKYDLIICEPSNPWVTGIEKLFSEEFYSLASEHLADGGLYVQWFPYSGVGNNTLLSILNTFQSSFEYAIVFSAQGGALTLVGSKKPIQPNLTKTKRRFEEAREIYEKFSMKTPQSVFFNQIFSPFMMRALVEKQTQTNSLFSPSLEFKSGRAFFAGVSADVGELLVKKLPLPVPKDLAENKFLHEKLEGPISKEALQDGIKVTNAFHFQRIRLLSLARRLYPTDSPFAKDFERFKDYSYLLGLEAEPNALAGEETNILRLGRLLGAFRNLLSVTERPQLSKVIPYVESMCGERDCYLEKHMAIEQLGAADELNKVGRLPLYQPSESHKKEVEGLWLGIKQRFGRLEAL